jgi:secreted trypsin-like serine protease
MESYLVHEGYEPSSQSQFNDIALIRLSRTVKFTDFIQPICLPLSSKLRNQNLDNKKLFVAGWGQNQYKQKTRYKNIVDVNGYPITKCNRIFKSSGIPLSTSHICAGGVKGKDSCKGDSGGPLMKVENPYWHIVGIVSFGASECGSEGIPGIYTRVSHYIDWITKYMRE